MAPDQVELTAGSAAQGLYVHIPFCLKRCHYCDFISQAQPRGTVPDVYIQAVKNEIQQRCCGSYETVYFGGGTPSLLSASQIEDLMQAVLAHAQLTEQPEITMEVNPATVDPVKLEKIKAMGIKRISLGVQSTQDTFLRLLGRCHSAIEAQVSYHILRKYGIDNINCDLMYGLPGQTLSEFKRDLKTLVSWQPDHISLYALTVEPRTLLSDEIANKQLPEIDDDKAAEMYTWACHYLAGQDLQQYELSNFAKSSYVCRHNLVYWTYREYLGVGLAAHSFQGGKRSWNDQALEGYIEKINKQGLAVVGDETLTGVKKCAEQLIVGLRLMQGIRKQEFKENYGDLWEDHFKEAIKRLSNQGLLVDTPDRLRLSNKGKLLSNIVFRELL